VETYGTVVEVHGIMATVLLPGGRRVRCRPPGPHEKPVVGDRVAIAEGDATTRSKSGADRARILSTIPRQRAFVRPVAPHRSQVVAAWVDRLLIVSAVDPPPRQGLVDRILCGVAEEPIDVVLVVNKVDLPGRAAALAELQPYRALGYRVLEVSAVTGEGLDELEEAVARGLSLVVGHSGVGKSSLMNRLVPAAELDTGEVNLKTGKGRHTTSVATCHAIRGPWPEGGLLVDTPGIRVFPLHGLEEVEIARRFPELRALAPRCRFADCLHEQEPGCVIAELLASDASREPTEGWLPRARYEAYLALLRKVREER